jgi:hypothetical protein
MSETFTARLDSGPHIRYAPGAWDRAIGDTIRVNLPGGGMAQGIIRGAVVNEDGSEAEITVELPDGTLPKPPGGYSIAGG